MRRQSLWMVLSAISVSAAACFPDYSFDLAEVDGPDASLSDDAATGDEDADVVTDAALDGNEPADAGDDASDGSDGGSQDAGPDGDAPTGDGGSDAGVGDAGPDSGLGDGGDGDGDPPPPEPDCSESSDDGAVYACVPRPPTGWSGPVALYHEASQLPPPSCPSTFFHTPIFDGHAELATGAAKCSPCSCSVAGVTCSAVTAEDFASGSSCSGACGWSSDTPLQFPPNSCRGITFNDATSCSPPISGSVGVSTPTGTPSCAPAAQTPTIDPVAWADNARACHAPSSDKGCEEGFLCAPKAAHPFAANLCIVRLGEGDVSCPEGPYSEKYVFYRDADDTRSCTECQCGAASNVRCEGALKTYSGTNGCTTQDGSIPLGGCGDFGPAVRDGDTYLKLFRLAVEAKATCPASGGQPTGTVTPTRPQTICCMP